MRLRTLATALVLAPVAAACSGAAPDAPGASRVRPPGTDFDDRPADGYYDGPYGGLVLSDHVAELDVATGCVPVSGAEAERLVAAGSVSSDD